MRTENYYIDYRYVPGSLGDGSSLDHGAMMRAARRTRKAAESFVAALKNDPRIQWVALEKAHVARSTSSYGGPAE